jgi:hypothetical protein
VKDLNIICRGSFDGFIFLFTINPSTDDKSKVDVT